MRTALLRMTTLAAVIVSLSPPVLKAQEGIFVTDFSTSNPIVVGLAESAKIRRGVTSTVEIVKNLIDLVPFGQIGVHNVTGIGISNLTNGKTSSSGTGFIRMSMTVPPGQTVGSTITLDVGFLDHFNFTVERTGRLAAAPTLTPNPSTVLAGTPIVVSGTGTDLGTPEVSALICHSVVAGPHTATSFTDTVRRTATSTCSTNNGPFGFGVHGTGTGDPLTYATGSAVARFPFPAYLVPPPTPGLTCASVPGIGAPVITSPANGQVFAFAAGANANQSMTIRWNLLTNSQQPAPNNEWLVSAPIAFQKGAALSTTVQGTQFTRTFPLPGTYTVSVRAKNCGETAPSTTVSFELKFQ